VITRAEVEHVARLARLQLTAEELARMASELGGILGYIDQLKALDTRDVEPTSHAVPLVNVMRDDVVGECLSAEEALASAPDPADGHFRVPRILED
jgi:aspartyl-tRNA(Asn)/glutamyl-tRNA(Gln) amidotransferase subunit C